VHSAHLFAIPYENFDVQLGRPVTIDIPPIYDKIVNRRRGGWCYEMNGILGWALKELGFKVTRATGSVRRSVFGDSSDGNHLVLRVELPDGVYLADVGFGDGPNDPIPVRVGAFESRGFVYGVARADGEWWRVTTPSPGGADFDFNLAPVDEALLVRKCHHLQTAETSNFVLNAVAQRHVRGGVTILRGRTLRRMTPTGVDDRLIVSADDLVATLKDVFSLDLPEAAGLWPRIVARHEQVMAEKRD
jgi:N-hydroxyarylamine O-acetyltransferase